MKLLALGGTPFNPLPPQKKEVLKYFSSRYPICSRYPLIAGISHGLWLQADLKQRRKVISLSEIITYNLLLTQALQFSERHLRRMRRACKNEAEPQPGQ